MSNSAELPEAVKRSLGIGINKTREFHLPDSMHGNACTAIQA